MKKSKRQFNQAIEGRSAANERFSSPAATPQSNRASKAVIAVLIAIIGIGAGWVGGKVLTGRLRRESSPAPTSEVSTGTTAPQVHKPEAPPAPGKTGSSGVNAAASQTQPDPEALEIANEHQPKKNAREAPPPVPRVNKEEEEGTAATEDSSKEIGRKALKKIIKENEKMNRERGKKKNEDEKN